MSNKQQSSIDEKLRSTIRVYSNRHAVGDEQGRQVDEFEAEAIAQIKQAFLNDGWFYRNSENKLVYKIRGGEPVMTGQEFYSRFLKEYVKLEGKQTGGTIMPRSNAELAARRAAGIPYGVGEVADMKHVQDKLDEPYSGITEAKDE